MGRRRTAASSRARSSAAPSWSLPRAQSLPESLSVCERWTAWQYARRALLALASDCSLGSPCQVTRLSGSTVGRCHRPPIWTPKPPSRQVPVAMRSRFHPRMRASSSSSWTPRTVAGRLVLSLRRTCALSITAAQTPIAGSFVLRTTLFTSSFARSVPLKLVTSCSRCMTASCRLTLCSLRSELMVSHMRVGRVGTLGLHAPARAFKMWVRA
mmetsp:Transcript_20317/g.57941  ORF Transcript_20317/g.57941 Transcript_20317/m.57941 type:complete len:212 (+) Transcript_20317:676-1311(+)